MDVLAGLTTLFLAFAVIAAVVARQREIATPLLMGFAIRALAAVIDAYVYPLPGNSDGPGWERGAVYYARNGLAGTFEHIGTGHELYKWMMSVLYALFGRSPLMIQAINVLLGTLIILNAWRLAKQLGGSERSCRIAAWVVTLSPSLIFYSATLQREAAVAYPLTLAGVALAKWYSERRPTQVLSALAALLVSMAFHSGGAAVLVFAGLWLTGSWLREAVTLRFRNFGRNTVALAVGLTVLAVVLSSGFGMQKFNGLEGGDIAVLGERQDGFSRGRAVYLGDLRADSPGALVLQAPIRVTYFLLAPFPWMLSEVSDVFGVLDSGLFFILIARVVRRRKALTAQPSTMLVLGVFGAMALVFALGVSNYGTALRHRNKMLPLLVGASLSLSLPLPRRHLRPVAGLAPRLAR